MQGYLSTGYAWLLVLAAPWAACAQGLQDPLPSRIAINEGWAIQSSTQVKEDGQVVSTAAFQPRQWYTATVPCTVLGALTRAGVYPDLRVGLNGLRIPDASDAFNQKHDLARYSHLPDKRNPWKDPYWYRTEFNLPRTNPGIHVWLNFQAINYRADVWLNGEQVAGQDTMVGALRRFRFDVTRFARAGKNCLAVKVFGPDHPGEPQTQLAPLGKDRGYQTELMKDVSLPMFVGYDCMPTVPDRNMGLWQEVFVDFTGPIDIRDPFVVTDLPLPDTSRAELTVSAELVNASTLPQTTVLKGTIIEGGVTFEKSVTLAPGGTKTVVFSRQDGPQPVLHRPRLWWPNQYGAQNLYHLRLTAEAGGQRSDAAETAFGVRTIAKELHALDGQHGLRLLVNGQKVYVRGGYIQPEIMFQWDAKRIDREVRYLAGANLNHVYFEDIANPPDEFLDVCDRHGLLFGNCFYGCYWMTPGSGRPADVDLLRQCTVDIIKRYRNHPCLWLYMAMNEGDTRQDVYEQWRRLIKDFDGTRIHIPSGSFPDYRQNAPEWIKPDMPVGMNDWVRGKSYGWQEPAQYFRWVRDERGWMFQMECGSPSVPPLDSLRRFVPGLFDAPPGPLFPLTSAWAHHDACHYFKPYDAALRRLFGTPQSVEDYAAWGELLSADQHRAMFEAVNHRLWAITSGFTQWKINACWPSVEWQIYDWYLRPTASYYSIKRACEPLHVQLDLLDQTVSVINHRFGPEEGLQVSARVYDFKMKLRWEKGATTPVGGNTFHEVFTVQRPSDLSGVYFVKLEVKDRDGNRLSDNFYWLCAGDPTALTALEDLPLVELEASHEIQKHGEETVASVTVKNPTDHLALCAHLALTKGPFGEEILPVYWEDNYISLLPGESRKVRARFRTEDLAGATPALEVGGWNILGPLECKDLKVSESRVKAGQALTVTTQIANTALGGSKIPLKVDGRSVAAKRFWARAGAGMARPLRFTLQLTAPGPHRISLGKMTSEVVVE